MPGPQGSTTNSAVPDEGTIQTIKNEKPGIENSYESKIKNECVWIELDFLFVQCLNPAMGLSENDFSDAAKSLGIEIEAIKAVAEVETSGNAFDDSGRPTILFERHYFHKLTGGKYDAKYPDISNATSGGYGKFSAQYGKLERAYKLDPDAALKSASWGRFQIMGANHKAAGFASVSEFVFAMTRSESNHLLAFVNFLRDNENLVVALKTKNWAKFAAGYNGQGYEKNHYDKKLEEAYERLSPKKTGTKK